MTEDAGFYNVKTDVGEKSASFAVNKGFDFVAKLDEISKDNSRVKDWVKK